MIKRIFAVLLGAAAAGAGALLIGRHTGPPEGNSKDQSFKLMTAHEKKEYVYSFLKDSYGLKCEVSEVRKREISFFENEDDYFASAITPDKAVISVWIDDAGNVTDTVFLLRISEKAAGELEPVIAKSYEHFKVKAELRADKKPARLWSSYGGVLSHLKEEYVTAHIYVFTTDKTDRSKEIAKALEGISACIYICCVGSLDEAEGFDLTKYTYHTKTEKENA